MNLLLLRFTLLSLVTAQTPIQLIAKIPGEQQEHPLRASYDEFGLKSYVYFSDTPETFWYYRRTRELAGYDTGLPTKLDISSITTDSRIPHLEMVLRVHSSLECIINEGKLSCKCRFTDEHLNFYAIKNNNSQSLPSYTVGVSNSQEYKAYKGFQPIDIMVQFTT
ncbi:uncharacterized protein CYBJADRAFT_167428 [Cyberlindnera jadinii NRRL Y-1542]|uniref:Uncharacterized protein n=1 Tax=Cyberlindnera jadinii (strain ATCC 18201 / CBS 1600 / BCRC 20928 / JCM 3617 / NBRC 0987 / NRRL Y-1542) TaxID=983966 RepID=A0A1E4S3F5_CYBJN|nr:hypothetical protein CYBJADRAFT_167428 [Cyberlindnera jadinii NRRL Y-1542]ODV74048.1 hypothetical protein CYBJADRAFT_167428 [Cyberlindnera jadinii NRRL Y-1542]